MCHVAVPRIPSHLLQTWSTPPLPARWGHGAHGTRCVRSGPRALLLERRAAPGSKLSYVLHASSWGSRAGYFESSCRVYSVELKCDVISGGKIVPFYWITEWDIYLWKFGVLWGIQFSSKSESFISMYLCLSRFHVLYSLSLHTLSQRSSAVSGIAEPQGLDWWLFSKNQYYQGGNLNFLRQCTLKVAVNHCM